VPTASFTLEVQRGSRPGAPKASPCWSSQRYLMAYELPPLPYDYNALEPHIDAERP
jgi:hypothetical protein